ncbi:MAG: transcription antitermination protein NusB [Bacteroidales bacterium]|nr:transcription antitermination protein NusB [Bacteroidales bacterium]
MRIKIMQALYAYYKHNGGSSLKNSEKELSLSITKTYDLYHYLLLLIIDVNDYARARIDLARTKKIPTQEDLNPNTKFADNLIVEQLRINKRLLDYAEKRKLNWSDSPELIRGIFLYLTQSEVYKNYMASPTRSYKEDRDFINSVFSGIISGYEPLSQSLEEQSIYWNDELEFVVGIIIKTLKKFKNEEGEDASLMPLYKNPEDENFSVRLLRKVVLKYDEYLPMIKQFSKNWEIDRIAFLDILLMEMAIAEAVEFPQIPVKVTLNEYLEIAKFYSTSKSNVFLNGILDKVFNHLKENNKIVKTGRGLIGEE